MNITTQIIDKVGGFILSVEDFGKQEYRIRIRHPKEKLIHDFFFNKISGESTGSGTEFLDPKREVGGIK